MTEDGNWVNEGTQPEVPLPPGGLENLPPPPKPTTSFHSRFLEGKADSVEAIKEVQKLRWMLSKHNVPVPYPGITF